MTDSGNQETPPLDPATPEPGAGGRPVPDPLIGPAGKDVSRVWTPIGEEYIRTCFEQGRRYHGDYDQQAIRSQIEEQITELTWQPPNGMVPLSPGLLLQAVVPQLALNGITAIALNGYLRLPDGPETATYSLLGVEGVQLRARQRLYLLDVGDGAVLLCADIGHPTRALEELRAKPGADTTAGHDASEAGEGRD